MAIVVAASEVQKNFGDWLDKAFEQPVEISRYGRTTAFLVSAKMYHDMLASYRRAIGAAEISDNEMALVRNAEVETDAPYNLDDISELDTAKTSGR